MCCAVIAPSMSRGSGIHLRRVQVQRAIRFVRFRELSLRHRRTESTTFCHLNRVAPSDSRAATFTLGRYHCTPYDCPLTNLQLCQKSESIHSLDRREARGKEAFCTLPISVHLTDRSRIGTAPRAIQQQCALTCVLRERRRPFKFSPRFLRASQLLQQVAANAGQQLIRL